jgi:hypothetical protein
VLLYSALEDMCSYFLHNYRRQRSCIVVGGLFPPFETSSAVSGNSEDATLLHLNMLITTKRNQSCESLILSHFGICLEFAQTPTKRLFSPGNASPQSHYFSNNLIIGSLAAKIGRQSYEIRIQSIMHRGKYEVTVTVTVTVLGNYV